MNLKRLAPQDYETWIKKFENRNFLQSSYEGDKMKKDGWDIHYLAGMKENTICVCAMVAIKPLMKFFRYAYIPRGPFYTNQEDLKEYYELVKAYLKKEKCVYLETDPYIPLRQRDENGQIVSDGWNHWDVVDLYKDMGFLHLPLTQGYDMTRQCRWMSVLYLENQTKEQVFKAFPSKTRQNIKNALKYNIEIRKLKKEELSILQDLVSMTGERRNFSALSLEYYQEQYECFKDKAQAYYAYLDIDAYVENIHQSIEKEKQVIEQAQERLQENPHSKNSQNRLHTATLHLESLYKRQEEAALLQKEHGHELGLAAAMFIFYGKEVKTQLVKLKGREFFIDSLVCNFQYSQIENGEKTNLTIPYKIFSDQIPPEKGINLLGTDSEGIPFVYKRNPEDLYGITESEFSETLKTLAEILESDKAAKEKGIIRSIYGNAIHKRPETPGEEFILWTLQSGGLNLSPPAL